MPDEEEEIREDDIFSPDMMDEEIDPNEALDLGIEEEDEL